MSVFIVLLADALFRSERRWLKNKRPPEKAHLVLQRVASYMWRSSESCDRAAQFIIYSP